MLHNGSHVLFVDDEPRVLASLRRTLRFKVDEWKMSFTSDVNEAISFVISKPPQVVVSDLRMPAMSGIEMIGQMRRSAELLPTFVLLTGNADMASAIDAINDAQVFRFLTKPCPTDELVHVVEGAIGDFLFRKRQDQPTDMSAKEAALSLLSPAIAMTDGQAQACYLNDSASDILAEHDGLFLDAAGIIRAAKTDVSKKLHQAIAHASTVETAAAQFFSIPRQSECRDLTLVVLPGNDGRAALVLTDPQRTAVLSPDHISSLFNLTKAEAQIAYTLANGGTLEDAAEASGITVSSVRTYLKRVFSKMDVSRQSDLVQLILTTPAPLIRPATQGKVA